MFVCRYVAFSGWHTVQHCCAHFVPVQACNHPVSMHVLCRCTRAHGKMRGGRGGRDGGPLHKCLHAIPPSVLQSLVASAFYLFVLSCCTCQAANLNACGQVLQVVGRQPARLVSSSFFLLACSLPRMAAGVCFLLERGCALPPVLNTLMKKPDVEFLRYMNVTQVRFKAAHF